MTDSLTELALYWTATVIGLLLAGGAWSFIRDVEDYWKGKGEDQ